MHRFDHWAFRALFIFLPLVVLLFYLISLVSEDDLVINAVFALVAAGAFWGVVEWRLKYERDLDDLNPRDRR